MLPVDLSALPRSRIVTPPSLHASERYLVRSNPAKNDKAPNQGNGKRSPEIGPDKREPRQKDIGAAEKGNE